MHRSNQKSKKSVLKLVLFFVLLLFVLVACEEGGGDNPRYVTRTPPPSATPTCEPNIRLSTPEGWGFSTRLFVILYDPRITEGGQYLELANGEKTQDVSLFIRSIVPALMRPSDQISIFHMGYSSYDDSRVARLYSYTTPPVLYNTPAPRETLTPLPPTHIPTPGFGEVATKNAIKVESTRMAGTEMANQAEYDCMVKIWNNTIETTAVAWGNVAATEVSNINNELNAAFQEVDKKEKPFASDELYYGGVYYGLNFATSVFEADCKNYDTCTLLIIDDMRFLGKNNPTNIINLSGVKTYVIMPNCLDMADANCKTRVDYWSSEFLKFGVDNPVYWNGVRAEINLLDSIGR